MSYNVLVSNVYNMCVFVFVRVYICVRIYVNNCLHARMYANVRESIYISVYARIRMAYRIHMSVSGCKHLCVLTIYQAIVLFK